MHPCMDFHGPASDAFVSIFVSGGSLREFGVLSCVALGGNVELICDYWLLLFMVSGKLLESPTSIEYYFLFQLISKINKN